MKSYFGGSTGRGQTFNSWPVAMSWASRSGSGGAGGSGGTKSNSYQTLSPNIAMAAHRPLSKPRMIESMRRFYAYPQGFPGRYDSFETKPLPCDVLWSSPGSSGIVGGLGSARADLSISNQATIKGGAPAPPPPSPRPLQQSTDLPSRGSSRPTGTVAARAQDVLSTSNRRERSECRKT